MFIENISQQFRQKNIDETRNYLIEEINQNELMSQKYKNVYRILNYIEHLFILMGFHFWFCFFSCYSYRNYDFFNRIENLCNNCRN